MKYIGLTNVSSLGGVEAQSPPDVVMSPKCTMCVWTKSAPSSHTSSQEIQNFLNQYFKIVSATT